MSNQIKKITIESARQCLDTLSGIDFNHYSPEGKYHLYICREYFKNNFSQFKTEEIKQLFSYPDFDKNIDQNTGMHILNQCLLQKRSFDIAINGWFPIHKKNKSLMKDYVELLNRENNHEQLAIFLKKDPELVYSVFKYGVNRQCDSMVSLVLKSNPNFIFSVNNPQWSRDKITHFLIENKDKICEIIKATSNLPSEHYATVGELVADYYIHKEAEILKIKNFTTDPLAVSLKQDMISLPDEFLFSFHEKAPSLLKHILSQKIKSAFYVGNEEYHTVNIAQEVKNNQPDHFFHLKFLPEKYLDLLLMPIDEHMGLYDNQTNCFEFFLRNKNYFFFKSFKNVVNRLPLKEQQIYTVAMISYLNESNIEEEIPEIFKQVPLPILSQYIQKAQKSSLIKQEILEKINKIVLFHELESSLEINQKSNQKIKI